MPSHLAWLRHAHEIRIVQPRYSIPDNSFEQLDRLSSPDHHATARPLGTLRGLAAVVRNPLELWSEEMYDSRLSVMRLPGQKFITVTDPELAKTVLLDDAGSYIKSRFVNRLLKPAMGNGLLTAEGANWRAQRRAAIERTGFSQLSSVRDKRVHGIWTGLIAVPPLNILFIERAAKWLHPARFEDIDPSATLAEINERFLSTPIKGQLWASLQE